MVELEASTRAGTQAHLDATSVTSNSWMCLKIVLSKVVIRYHKRRNLNTQRILGQKPHEEYKRV